MQEECLKWLGIYSQTGRFLRYKPNLLHHLPQTVALGHEEVWEVLDKLDVDKETVILRSDFVRAGTQWKHRPLHRLSAPLNNT